MSQPVKISDELILDARLTAEIAERSIAGQIGFWAQLGRAAVAGLRFVNADVLAERATCRREVAKRHIDLIHSGPKSFGCKRRGSLQGGTPMPLRLGPGPVFVYESIAATRRWQLYALRSFFVLSLLAALFVIWIFVSLEQGSPAGTISIKDLAEGGQYFFYAIATTQLAVVLLVAPAATAGAICLDRARGNLTHMLVTDLADGEIVLGKLAARFLPVVGLVAATIPVLALSGLLGGVIFEAILALTLITLALAAFGCALALAISVRATKTHEVLMAVYAIESLWILSPIVWEILSSTNVMSATPADHYGRQSVCAGLGALCVAGLCERKLARGLPGCADPDLGGAPGLCGHPAPGRDQERACFRQPPLGSHRVWPVCTRGFCGGVQARHWTEIRSCGANGVVAGPRALRRRLGAVHRLVGRRRGDGNRDDCPGSR